MLSFTFRGTRITGTYNGRFVFRAPLEVSPLSIAALKALSDGEESALDPDILQHEYLHWLTFRRSKFGIETIGRRFRARSEFMHGSSNAVVDYYRQRTAYFCSAYDAHEDIVDQLQKECAGLPLSQTRAIVLGANELAKVASADHQAREATRALRALSSPPRRFVDFAKGYVATREYGLQNYVPDDSGKVRIREVALSSGTQGLVNAAFETEIGAQGTFVSLLKRLRRSLNTEGRAGGLTMHKMSTWAVLKFAAEADALRRLSDRGYRTLPEGFAGYTEQIVDFAFRYTLSPKDRLLQKNLVALLRDCDLALESPAQIKRLTDRFMEFDEGVLYYFYIHGN